MSESERVVDYASDSRVVVRSKLRRGFVYFLSNSERWSRNAYVEDLLHRCLALQYGV